MILHGTRLPLEFMTAPMLVEWIEYTRCKKVLGRVCDSTLRLRQATFPTGPMKQTYQLHRGGRLGCWSALLCGCTMIPLLAGRLDVQLVSALPFPFRMRDVLDGHDDVQQYFEHPLRALALSMHVNRATILYCFPPRRTLLTSPNG